MGPRHIFSHSRASCEKPIEIASIRSLVIAATTPYPTDEAKQKVIQTVQLATLHSPPAVPSQPAGEDNMKVITANFVTCAVKDCKTSPASYPLHFHDAELELQELDFQPEFIRNVIPRIDWEGLRATANEVSRLMNLLSEDPETDAEDAVRVPESPRVKTGGRGTGQRANTEGFASAAAGDPSDGRKTGLWQLRP